LNHELAKGEELFYLRGNTIHINLEDVPQFLEACRWQKKADEAVQALSEPTRYTETRIAEYAERMYSITGAHWNNAGNSLYVQYEDTGMFNPMKRLVPTLNRVFGKGGKIFTAQGNEIHIDIRDIPKFAIGNNVRAAHQAFLMPQEFIAAHEGRLRRTIRPVAKGFSAANRGLDRLIGMGVSTDDPVPPSHVETEREKNPYASPRVTSEPDTVPLIISADPAQWAEMVASRKSTVSEINKERVSR
jgi:hypothetical protein